MFRSNKIRGSGAVALLFLFIRALVFSNQPRNIAWDVWSFQKGPRLARDAIQVVEDCGWGLQGQGANPKPYKGHNPESNMHDLGFSLVKT